MSIGFNWFKNYEIYIADEYYNDCNLRYIGGDSTSHSAHNIIKVQQLLEKYGGIRIPSIRRYDVSTEPDLIEPKIMSEICNKILQTTEVDEVDMRDRIEWFKKLSDEGYYLSYDLSY